MLVGGSPSSSYSRAPVCRLRVTRGAAGGRSAQGSGDRQGCLREVGPEAASDLPHLWAWARLIPREIAHLLEILNKLFER
ncbi:hypothetical protein B5X24_HaOG216005 [Helicoverpa armigera]|nr:hypothetical protein B5X24_HaOG216005 [Helicoverpa armigera]